MTSDAPIAAPEKPSTKADKPKYPPPKALASVEEVAAKFHTLGDGVLVRGQVVQRVLDLSHSTWYRLRRKPEFPKPYKLPPGGDPRFKVSDIRAFMATMRADK